MSQVRQLDLLSDGELKRLVDDIKPRTILNCTACETDQNIIPEEMYRTRFLLTQRLLTEIEGRGVAGYIHITCVSRVTGKPEQDLTAGMVADLIAPDLVLESDAAVADDAVSNFSVIME